MLNRRVFIGALGAAVPVAANAPGFTPPSCPGRIIPLEPIEFVDTCEKRLAIYSISSDCLHEMIEYLAMDPAKRDAVRISGLPEGAKFRRAHYEWRVDAFHLVFSHPSFAPVPDCAEIPQLYFTSARLRRP